jgi:hypothetical protein
MSKDNVIEFRPWRERYKRLFKERLRERLRQRLREEEKRRERESKIIQFKKKKHHRDEHEEK